MLKQARAMAKKTHIALERLQRTAQADRPDEVQRERVADELLTQDQLRKIDKTLGKIANLPGSGKGKRPKATEADSAKTKPQSAQVHDSPAASSRATTREATRA
jgi:hypothetical protein